MRIAVAPAIGTDKRVPKGAQPRPAESTFVHIAALAEKDEPVSEEELQALLSRYVVPGRKPRFPAPAEPWHKAQELAYQGWEKRSERGRARLARLALEKSPDAADGYLLLAHDASSWREATGLCSQGVAAAERLMEPDYLTVYEGAFWGAALTRPYMRARFALGYCLWRQGRHEEAVGHFRDLIRLNPGDNQGARYVLVAILLELEKENEAQSVMACYRDDMLSHWLYNRTLVQFRRRGGRRRTQTALRRAVDGNSLVLAFLLGNRRVSSYDLDLVEPGEASEAIEYHHLYKAAWAMTAGALDWLGEQLAAWPMEGELSRG